MTTETTSQTEALNGSGDEWKQLDEKLSKAESELPQDYRNEPDKKSDGDGLSKEGEQAAPTEGTDAPNPETKPEPVKPAGSDTPDAATTAAQQQQQQKPGEQPKELSKFEKAKQREAKAWQEINTKKAEIQQLESTFQTRERDLYAREQALIQYQQSLQSKNQFTPEQYEKAAEKLEADGNFDMAQIAREEAQRVRANPPQQQPQQGVYVPPPEIVAAQHQHWEEVKREIPELTQQGSEINQRFIASIKANPEFLHYPAGPRLLATHLKLGIDAAKYKAASSRVPELEKENGSLKKQIEELQKLTAIEPGRTSSQPVAGKSFEDMSLDEQEREIRAMVAENS